MANNKPDLFANALSNAQADKTAQVYAAYGSARELHARVDIAALAEPGRQRHQVLGAQLEDMYQRYTNVAQAHEQSIATRVSSLKNLKRYGKLAELAALLLGVILLFEVLPLGVILIAGAVIAHFVLKRVTVSKAQALATEAWGPASSSTNEIGRAETYAAPASGVYAGIDGLYLESLDAQARGFELQRRQTDKQMQQMQAQHQAVMAQQQEAMAKQQAAMSALINENQATNDALYGSPGVIGSALRARDRVKRNS